MCLVGVSPACFQSQMFWVSSQVLLLNIGVLALGYKPFTIQGEASGFEFLPHRGSLCGGGGWVGSGEIISQLFYPLQCG